MCALNFAQSLIYAAEKCFYPCVVYSGNTDKFYDVCESIFVEYFTSQCFVVMKPFCFITQCFDLQRYASRWHSTSDCFNNLIINDLVYYFHGPSEDLDLSVNFVFNSFIFKLNPLIFNSRYHGV